MVEDKYVVYSLVINSKNSYFIDSEPSKRWAEYAPWDGWGLVGRCGWAAFGSKRIEESFWHALKFCLYLHQS